LFWLLPLQLPYILQTTSVVCLTSFSAFFLQLTVRLAVLEWTIAFGYTFYLLTFAYDLRMAKGVHRGQLSKGRLRDMQERGIPISQATAGHEGNPRASDDSNYHGHIYPDGYSGSGYRGSNYAHSTTTNGTMGTHNGYPMTAGNDRGANAPYNGYNTRGYA
jgi:hypothetical protein